MPCRNPTIQQTTVNGTTIEYDLHRSPRRRTSISLVVEDNRLRVLAPKRTALVQIHDLLEHRADWIHKRLAAPAPPRLRDQLRPGGQLPLLGKQFPVESGARTFAFEGRRFLVNAELADLATVAERWFRDYARTEFADRVEQWAEEISVKPARIQIRNQKTRWGSASSKGTLSFNWRLVFATPEIIDYVVVHELCHLIQPNHSPAYWQLVESNMPDYREHRQALKDAADSLVW